MYETAIFIGLALGCWRRSASGGSAAACPERPCGYEVVSPPSTDNAAPVTPLASDPQSQAMRAAGSSGSSRRSTSCWWANSSAEARS